MEAIMEVANDLRGFAILVIIFVAIGMVYDWFDRRELRRINKEVEAARKEFILKYAPETIDVD